MGLFTKTHTQELGSILSEEFSDENSVAQLVRSAFDAPLRSISRSHRLGGVVLDLINWAEAHDRLPDLLQAALSLKPASLRLNILAAEIQPSVDPGTDFLQKLSSTLERRLHEDQVTLQILRQHLTEVEERRDYVIRLHAELESKTKDLTSTQAELETVKKNFLALQEQDSKRIELLEAENRQLEINLAAARTRIAELEAAPLSAAPLSSVTSTNYPDRLTPAQHRSGHAAMLTAFTKRSELALLTRQALDVLLNTISNDADLSSVLTDLLDWAEAKGRLPALLAGVAEANPENKRLQRWLAEVRGDN